MMITQVPFMSVSKLTTVVTSLVRCGASTLPLKKPRSGTRFGGATDTGDGGRHDGGHRCSVHDHLSSSDYPDRRHAPSRGLSHSNIYRHRCNSGQSAATQVLRQAAQLTLS